MDRKTVTDQKDLKKLKIENYSMSGTEHRKLRVSEFYRQPVVVKRRKREIKGGFFLSSDTD